MTPSPPATTVGTLLQRTAAVAPDRTAIWTPARQLTYRELLTEAAALAAGLRALDLPHEVPIALVMPNLAEAFVSYFAVALAGYRILPVGPRLIVRELEAILGRWSPELAICGGATKEGPVAEKLLGLAACPRRVIWAGQPGERSPGRPIARYANVVRAGQHGASAVLRDRSVQPEDDWIIQLTSGTTALPKGARLGHGQCTRMAYEVARRHGLRPGDRYFGGNPVHHLGCTNFVLLPSIAAAATFYTLPNFQADEALEVLARERCTVHTGVPAHYLLEMMSPRLDPSALSLRTLTVGGGPPMAQRVREAFKTDGVVQRYGASESGGAPICGDHRDPLELRLRTFGHPLPGIEVRIVDPDHGAVVPPGAEGEIQLRGWSIMRGYSLDPEATARTLDPDGWLRTGDRGSLDEGSNLSFYGRLRDVLRVGGENVAASEIESVLESHPAVHHAVVVPVPHTILNEVPAAFVELKRGARCELDELSRLCATDLARFKRPAHLWFVDHDELPLTETGKVRKAELREIALKRLSEADAR